MLGNYRPPETHHGRGVPALRAGAHRAGHVHVPDEPGNVRTTNYLHVKRTFDLFCGVALGVMLFPIIALFSALIVITSPGPAFYTQTRLGRFGRPFVIWKHRTMRHNCERESGAKWSTKGDTRITFLGKILRKLHIDEFPQIINVLKGDMSLVGPRPERPEFFPALQASVPDYARRLLLKPGVTGMAQVYLPPDEDVESVRMKQIYDLYYVRHVGLLLDVRLLIATPLQAVGVPHFLVRPALCLPTRRLVELEHSLLSPTSSAVAVH